MGNQAENLINKEINKVSATGQVRLDIVVKRTGFYPTIDHEERLVWQKVPDYHYFREYLTVYVNITDNQTIGCSLIYIMEKFFVVELKPGSIAERSGIENGDEILMINDSTATHTSDHDFGALFKQKKMTLSYVKSNIDQLTKLFQKLSNAKQRNHYIKTIEALKKRINPDSTPSVSKSFINQSMSSSTDKSEEEDVFGEDLNGDVVPKSPTSKPPGRTSFIIRNTRPSFIGPPGGNSSDEEPRKTFSGRKTIGGETCIDDDLEDMLANRMYHRNSMKQPSEPQRNTRAGFLGKALKNGMEKAQNDKNHPLNRNT